jgi:hypothetical protein
MVIALQSPDEFVKESGPDVSAFMHVYGGIRSADDYAPYEH